MKKSLFTMKLAVILGLAFLVALSMAAPQTNHSRGCYYINGRCVKDCEEGTHAYAVGCATVMSEPTCAQPTPASRGLICDFSACYCDAPTVRHEGTDKCVKLEDCDKVE
ncbi:unnamed protein product [Plutella xylostella]|uniref:(diamondback moth) hypothetical protein n=1 Tax=Plutella xylostella TaxID=51655 RepID=A0A8S4FQL4_PLUXY|nr:unnamed protein product [Plutella xylostella]